MFVCFNDEFNMRKSYFSLKTIVEINMKDSKILNINYKHF